MSFESLGAGLSPRERGNHTRASETVRRGGSIPARAGEPVAGERPVDPLWVYPRASGGTISIPIARRPRSGLSPRERGNRRRCGCPLIPRGSIPARAGEPLSKSTSPTTAMVYPRASGGTAAELALLDAANGLSPRERGNRTAMSVCCRAHRSIPARAGEPPA